MRPAARPQGLLLWRDDASSWFADVPETATAVSVLGSMRPDHLMEALADGNDGFAAGFLYAWPDPAPYCRLDIPYPQAAGPGGPPSARPRAGTGRARKRLPRRPFPRTGGSISRASSGPRPSFLTC